MDYNKILKKYGESIDTISSRKFATLTGMGKTKALKVLSELRNGSTKKLAESNEIVGDTWNINIPSTRICTLEQLIEHAKVDLTQWQVERFFANKWEVGAKDANGNIVVEPLFQVKATFRRPKGMTVEAVKGEIERLKDAAKSEIKPFYISKKYSDKGNALEISIADLHSGKLAWGEETLGANYDHKIAAKLYENAFTDILGRTSVPLEKILLVIGNDLLNSDSRAGTTTRGTIVNNDSRYHKNFLSVWDLVSRQVETCLQIAPVDVMMVPGNHDEMSVWHLGHSLECFYANNKFVKIDNSPAYRKYWQFGTCMVMGTHGNDIKLKDLPLLMATEMPEMFASSTHREIHLGHLHQERLTEQFGVRTRIIPSLSPADWWHTTNGYTGNIRGAQGFVWNKNDGLIEIKEHAVKALAE